MTYNPHDGDHAGGALTTCRVCRDLADDTVRSGLGLPRRRWYVSVRYGKLVRLAAGPFDAIADAVAAVDPVRRMVDRDFAHDPRLTWAGFGVSSSTGSIPTLYGTALAAAA